MINLNYTLLIQAAVFIVFVFLINLLLFRPIVQLLERRRDATTGKQKKALDLKEKAENEAAILEKRLVRARQEASLERDRLRRDVLEGQKAAMERVKRAIEADVTALREKALNEAGKVEEALREGMEPLAERIMEKVLGRAA